MLPIAALGAYALGTAAYEASVLRKEKPKVVKTEPVRLGAPKKNAPVKKTTIPERGTYLRRVPPAAVYHDDKEVLSNAKRARENLMSYFVTHPDSSVTQDIVPVPPLPVSSAPSKVDSGICSAVVAGATAAGLPAALAGPAHQLCTNLVAEARSLGISKAKQVAEYVAKGVKAQYGKWMAKKGGKGKMAATVGKTLGQARNQVSVPKSTYAAGRKAAPAAYSVRQGGTSRPKISSSSRGLQITHSEMLGSLFSSATTLNFACSGFVVNPGKYSTFPWLSTLAGNFDKYVLRKFVVRLVSNQPTSTGGKIGIGFDYDSTDPLPTDRNEFFSLTHHVECAPWDSIELNVPIDQKPKFVNSHTLSDSKLIDCGQVVFMADQVVATSTSLADIIVEYTVELLEPQQAVYTTMSLYASHPSSFDNLTVVGPVVVQQVPTTSTTVLEFKVPQGYYELAIALHDDQAGSPLASVTVHNCITGVPATWSGGTQIGSTTDYVLVSRLGTQSNDATVRITFSGVAIADLERLAIVFTRVSSAVYRNHLVQGAFTTY